MMTGLSDRIGTCVPSYYDVTEVVKSSCTSYSKFLRLEREARTRFGVFTEDGTRSMGRALCESRITLQSFQSRFLWKGKLFNQL
jgi:hypothetical protein